MENAIKDGATKGGTQLFFAEEIACNIDKYYTFIIFNLYLFTLH
jgi:hypothetical protein